MSSPSKQLQRNVKCLTFFNQLSLHVFIPDDMSDTSESNLHEIECVLKQWLHFQKKSCQSYLHHPYMTIIYALLVFLHTLLVIIITNLHDLTI